MPETYFLMVCHKLIHGNAITWVKNFTWKVDALHILVVAFMLLSTPMAFAETLKIEIEERKFGKSEILVEIALPSTASNKNNIHKLKLIFFLWSLN